MTEIDKQIDKQLRDKMNEDWVVCEHKKLESGDRRHCALTRGRRRERGTAAGAGVGGSSGEPTEKRTPKLS